MDTFFNALYKGFKWSVTRQSFWIRLFNLVLYIVFYVMKQARFYIFIKIIFFIYNYVNEEKEKEDIGKTLLSKWHVWSEDYSGVLDHSKTLFVAPRDGRGPGS